MARVLERERELAGVRDLIAWAAPGTAGALCLVGPAGAGKSTVLGLWAERARDGGLAVWRATGSELEATSPYGVLRQLLGRPLADLDGETLSRITQGPARLAVDLVRDVESLALRHAHVDPARVTHSVFWLLDALTESRPALLMLDDGQWADAASLQVIDTMVDRMDDLRLSVAVASRQSRPTSRSAGISSLVGHRSVRTLRLEPLSVSAVADLIADVTGHEVGPGVAAVCAEVTDGNPFLVVELAGLLAEERLDIHDASADVVRGLVPTSVVDAVVRRLSGLDDADRTFALAVAVLESAPLRLACASARIDTSTGAAAADRLREAGLLARASPLTFRHALLRSAVLEAAGADRLAELRRRAAGVLALEPDGVHRAAALWSKTEGIGDPAAVDCLSRAAQAALEAGAPGEAVRLLQRAVAEPPATERLLHLTLMLGLALLRTGDAACVATLERAMDTLPDPVARAQAAGTLALAYNFGGGYAQSVAVLERALADLTPGSGLALEIEAGVIQAALQVPGQVEMARERLRARSPLTGAGPGERVLLALEAAIGNATSQPVSDVVRSARLAIGDPGEFDRHPEEHEWSLARLHLAAAGRYDEVAASCAPGLDEVTCTGSVIGFLAINLVRGFAELLAGELAEAETDFVSCIDLVANLNGGEIVETLARAWLVEVLVARGRIAEAADVACLDQPVSEASFNGSINLLRSRALVRLAQRDPVGALSDLAESRRRLDEILVDNPPWCPWRVASIEAHWSLGQLDEARALLTDELAQAALREDLVQRGVARRWAGMLVPDSDQSNELLASVRDLAGTEARLELARSQVALGAALRRGNQRAEARTWLLEGRAGAARCGADVLLATAEAELAAAGARPRRIETTGVDALTVSERRVCELAAEGLRNREIAQHFFLSPRTVEIHLSRSFRKLGIGGRDQLAGVLAEDGPGQPVQK